MMNLTENEKAIMKAGCDSEYDNFCEAPTWVFSVIDNSKLDAKIARGVISSLVKKGLVEVFDNEGRGKANDMAITATESGIEICNELGFNGPYCEPS
jgi:predicted transcriptional regulator